MVQVVQVQVCRRYRCRCAGGIGAGGADGTDADDKGVSDIDTTGAGIFTGVAGE